MAAFRENFFYLRFILIICHFGHSSSSMLFLNVARYRLLAISGTTVLTPIDVRLRKKFPAFEKEKYGQRSGCWQRPKHLKKKLFPKTYSFGPFLRQKWHFEGPKFWSKTPKKYVFFPTNQFSISVHPQVTTKYNLCI